MRKIIDSVFVDNLAKNAQISVSTYRGESKEFAAGNLIDSNPQTYWTINDGETKSSILVQFESPKTVNFILLQEYIQLGQRVEMFSINSKVDGEWKQIAEGTTIGYKRILEVPSVETTAIKVEIETAKASPLINNFEIYQISDN